MVYRFAINTRLSSIYFPSSFLFSISFSRHTSCLSSTSSISQASSSSASLPTSIWLYLLITPKSVTGAICELGKVPPGSPSHVGLLTHLLRSEYGTFQLFSGDTRAKEGEMFFWGIISFLKGLGTVGARPLCES